MNYIILNQQGSLLKDNLAAVNLVMKPAGYSFDVDELTRTIFIKDHEENVIEMINYKNVNEEIKFDCELDQGRAMNFNFDIKNKKNSIIIEDPVLGIYNISVQFDLIGPNRMFQTENGHKYADTASIILKNANITINDSDYSITYSAYENGIYISKINENDTLYSIVLSRNNDNCTSLTFKTITDESERRIESYGYEGNHKIACDCGLNEDYYRFKVYYHEEKFNGTKINIDQNRNDDYKHFGNEKLINNARVREFLDEVIGKYKELFTYETLENGILGGRLIDTYKNGEPNNSKVANNMLDVVGFPVKKQNKARKRKNNK